MARKNGSQEAEATEPVEVIFDTATAMQDFDQLGKRAESPAEALMLPILLTACIGWQTNWSADYIVITAQAELPELGRVDWLLQFPTESVAVILEVDGLAYHNSQEQFANDRQRDRAALRAGYTAIRFTAKELAERGWWAAVELHNTVGGLIDRERTSQPPEPKAIPAPRGVGQDQPLDVEF